MISTALAPTVERAETATTRTSLRGSSPGFTLLELLIVLILLGAAALIVMPSFSGGLGGIQLETTTRDLITHMRRARSSAVAEQRVHRIILRAPDTPGGPYGYQLTDEFERPLGTVDLPRGIAFAGEENLPYVVSFYPSGRSSGGFIILVQEGGRRLGIDVSPITGYGKFQRSVERDR
jgi:general secretion pathway protein H